MEQQHLARAFGRTAARYESGRPHWPAEAVDAAGLPAEAVVVDLAAGTGKLTRVLTATFARVVAVEPLAEMRAVLERMAPGAEVLPGVAERIPLPDESADGVFAADAFHWFDLRRALPEIARVLKPGGVLAVLFSGPDGPTEPEIDGVHDVLERNRRPREHPADRFESGAWLEDFAGSPFGDPVEHAFEYEQEVSRAQLLDYFASVSWIAALERSELDELLQEVEELLPDVAYRRRWAARVWVRHLRSDTI
jgi:SAM-dependent methyltransferase